MNGPRTRGTLFKGLVLTALHLLIVSSLGAKLLYDRGTRPHVWVETTPYDPELPIRGRYVRLRLVVDAPDIAPPTDEKERWHRDPVTLLVEGDRLVARRDSTREQWEEPTVRFLKRGDTWVATLDEPVAFFIPEHVADPSRRPSGEALWVEVTLPRKGPPRPIRLGVRTDGPITPLLLD
jgi:GDYXXLXY motif protein